MTIAWHNERFATSVLISYDPPLSPEHIIKDEIKCLHKTRLRCWCTGVHRCPVIYGVLYSTSMLSESANIAIHILLGDLVIIVYIMVFMGYYLFSLTFFVCFQYFKSKLFHNRFFILLLLCLFCLFNITIFHEPSVRINHDLRNLESLPVIQWC